MAWVAVFAKSRANNRGVPDYRPGNVIGVYPRRMNALDPNGNIAWVEVTDATEADLNTLLEMSARAQSVAVSDARFRVLLDPSATKARMTKAECTAAKRSVDAPTKAGR